ncbi:MAG: hypothetical protein HQ568_01775, partial [Calditrichaeota bacterium]|nr:hypothetical protein [Calditrichota bacterium]
MKPRQKSIITISAILLVIVSSLLIWYFYAGREYARLTLNNYLKTRLNSTLEIQSLSLNSNGLSITGVNLELTPQMTLTIDEVFIRISVFRLLSSGLEMSGSVKEISFISPVLHISKAPETASRSKEFLYHPYPLKPFSELKFIRRIIISDAGVSAGDENTMLADSISGRVDLMDISNVNLSMYGIINKIPNARIEVDGSLNLREGSFLLVTRAIIDDIKSWKIPEDNDKLRLGGGLVRVKIEARGADDLRISGIIETDSIAFSIGEQIQISNGFMRGELFGSSMGMQGSFAINSVTLPFTADIPDILKLKWTTEIASSGVDLSKLDNEISGLPKISGNIDLNSRFNGQGSDWHGLISVDGNNISVEEIKIDEFDLDAGMDSRRLRVNNLNAQVFGGELFLNGLLMFSDDGSEIEAFFNRNWIGDEAKSLFNADSLQLALNGRFKQVRGMWSGNGRGELLDRENSVLLSGALKMKNRKLTSHVTSPDEEGWLGLSLKREADSFRYQISTHNPHYALKRVLNKKYLPEFLHDYSLNFDLDGSGKQFKVDLRWEYEDGVRGGLYQSNIVRKANRWESKSNIRLLLDNGQTLTGRSEAEFGDGRLNLKNLVLSDEKDTQLLKAAFRYSDNESGVFETNILASNLPVAALIRFMKPDLATGCRSDLTTSIKGSNDSLDFNGRLSVGYPDGLKMTGIVNGDYINKLLTFDRFEIVNELEGKDIFTFEGEVDFAEDSLKSVVIRAVDFPIGRVLDLIQMDYSQEFDGRLNSRFELDGSMAHPDITSNVHVSGATIQRNGGYWMNIRSITKDSLYLFEQFDFGADVLKLIDVTGYVNRYDSSYD